MIVENLVSVVIPNSVQQGSLCPCEHTGPATEQVTLKMDFEPKYQYQIFFLPNILLIIIGSLKISQALFEILKL